MSIFAFDCNKHLGDTIGAFLNADFAGLIFKVPLTVTWADEATEECKVILRTQYVETFSSWDGHPVLLNDTEVGRIKDPSNVGGPQEITEIVISKASFPGVFDVGSKITLAIILEKQANQLGFLDDFLLSGVRTAGFSVRLG